SPPALPPPHTYAHRSGSPHTYRSPSRWSADPDPGWTAPAARTAGGTGALSFPGQSGEVFFSMHIRLGVQPPQFNDQWQLLLDGKCVDPIQPLFRRIRYVRIRILRHHIGDVLKLF